MTYKKDKRLNYSLALLSAFNLQGGRPGIFVAPFLLASGWSEGHIGQALFAAGLMKMCFQAPCGHFIDSSHNKRSWLAGANAITICACVIMYFSQPTYLLFTLCLVAQGMGEAAAYPGLYSLTLGMVPTELVAAQVGINETANHMGSMLYAVLASVSIFISSTAAADTDAKGATAGGNMEVAVMEEASTTAGLDGGRFLFIVVGMGCVALLLLVTHISAKDIDHNRACGLPNDCENMDRKREHELLPLDEPNVGTELAEKVSVLNMFRSVEPSTTISNSSSSPSTAFQLLQVVPAQVYLFYLCIVFFHLGNAAMLPLLSQSQPAITGAAIIVSQITMVGSASLCSLLLDRWGTRAMLAVCFACIPVRGVVVVIILQTAPSQNYLWMLATQVLDGIAGGIFGVIAVVSAATYAKSDNSALQGRFSLLIGAVKTMECLGASFSNLIGEFVAEYSYTMAFAGLGAVGILPLLLICMCSTELADKKLANGEMREEEIY